MAFANINKEGVWRITTFRPKDWECFDHQFSADGFFGGAIYLSQEWDSLSRFLSAIYSGVLTLVV